MTQTPVLGFIYGMILTRVVELPPALAERRTVLVNCYDAKRSYPSVVPGDLLGAQAATERLIAANRERIGFINGQQGLDASRDRLKGYRRALKSNDSRDDPSLVRPGNWEQSAGYEMTQDLMAMELANPPDAIFCANDVMAIGCYNALAELGLKVPEDVAVIGFDDREVAKQTRPR